MASGILKRIPNCQEDERVSTVGSWYPSRCVEDDVLNRPAGVPAKHASGTSVSTRELKRPVGTACCGLLRGELLDSRFCKLDEALEVFF